MQPDGRRPDGHDECVLYLEQEGSTTCYATKADSVHMAGGYIPDTEYGTKAMRIKKDAIALVCFAGLFSGASSV